MRPPEITSRIRRDELLELLETQAPAKEQRITARMPAVTLTGLLRIDDEPPPPPDADTLDPPTVPRLHVRAQGTVRAIRALEVEPALAGALEGLMSSGLAAAPAAEEPATPALIVDRVPVEPSPPRKRVRRAKTHSQALDLPPLNACEIASLLERIHEHDDAPAAIAAPANEPAQAPAPMPPPRAALVLATTPAPVLEVATLATPFPRMLVIAASCTLTLVVALLISLL